MLLTLTLFSCFLLHRMMDSKLLWMKNASAQTPVMQGKLAFVTI